MNYLILFVMLLSVNKLFATHPWPLVDFQIGHTINSYQKIDGGAAYFHHGLDIVSTKNAQVFVSAPGIVKKIGSYGDYDDELYYEVIIQDEEGNTWKYHHLDEYSISKEIKAYYKNQKVVPSKTYIGKLVTWPFKMEGKPFHHLHLDILDKNNNYLNPFDFLDPLSDTLVPIISKIELLKLAAGYTITLETYDLIDNTDFKHPPQKIEIVVDNNMPQTVWDFKNLPGGSDKKKFVHDFYLADQARGDYEERKYVINLAFDKTAAFKFPSDSGAHSLIVRVFDYANNISEKEFIWEIK